MSYNDSRGEKDVCRVNAGGVVELMMMVKVQEENYNDEGLCGCALSGYRPSAYEDSKYGLNSRLEVLIHYHTLFCLCIDVCSLLGVIWLSKLIQPLLPTAQPNAVSRRR